MHFPLLPRTCTIVLTVGGLSSTKKETLGLKKKTKTIYLAGPMRGIKDFNFPAFYAQTDKLLSEGWVVFNPAERDDRVNGKGVNKSDTGDLEEAVQKGFSLREALADDTQFITLHATAICMLPGWETSKGAVAEKALAEALGLDILYA